MGSIAAPSVLRPDLKQPALFRLRAARRRVPLPAGRVFERALAVADLEAVTTIDGLDVEDVFRGEAQHALDRRGYVLMHPVGKLNHDHGALARRSNQTTGDSSRASTKLPQHDLHDVYSSNLP